MQNTTLIYLKKNGHTLLLRKNSGGNLGKWIGVGGHMEENESPWDCIRREVAEETGMTLHSARFCGIVTFVSDCWEGEQMFLFTSDDFSGETGECDEGELRWIADEEMDALPTWEGDRIFLRLLQQGETGFLLKLIYEGDTLKSAFLNGDNPVK